MLCLLIIGKEKLIDTLTPPRHCKPFIAPFSHFAGSAGSNFITQVWKIKSSPVQD